ncbi:23S rRNA (adenine(2503)-C(2))-methyltransferase RlmN [Candidatus Peregrinibacteria bacterium CG11_big_fil_rev_8_21_14_0_20_46_8]|nr:MAG: 23S rRNA (adenine(2503)-C(2))-methyltransferase RlmN [Candidatus Peregrinibacteria bacterium CG11_big_fil_rev_8_21_14_0_20_46_8]
MQSMQEIQEYLRAHKLPEFRAKQILQAVYKEGKGSYDEIAVLPKNLREQFARDLPILCFEKTNEVRSKSGDTVKTLFKLHDGLLVEGVLMRFKNGRNSVCISSQVGCGLKCTFCATGTMGFTRNLTVEEIADQVLYFDQMLKSEQGARVTHVIFMGMGEPFLNYDNVIGAIRTLNDPDCLNLAARHITVSTSGIVPSINKLADFPLQVNLAVSIHAPNQELRESMMPIAKAYKLDQLIAALKAYGDKTKRRISYEYVMLYDKNDSPELARQLAELIRGQRAHVNLIPYNETYLGFKNAGKSRIDHFREILESYKIPTTVRVSLGQDISAACGQLAVEERKPPRPPSVVPIVQ